MKTLSMLAAALATTACATTPEEAGTGFCGVERLGALRGRDATADLGAEALRRSRARTLRWIRPGDMVTMDFRQDRLNIDLDSAGRISGFRCG